MRLAGLLALALAAGPAWGAEPPYGLQELSNPRDVGAVIENFRALAEGTRRAVKEDGNGNVGIGTTEPVFQLDVSSYAQAGAFCLSAVCITDWAQSGVGAGTITVNTSQMTGNGSGGTPVTLLSSSVTLQGNTFNGANQLLKADSNGLLPNADLDSSSVTLLGPSVNLADAETTGTTPVSKGGTNATSYTAGSVIFAGASGTSLAQDNANIFWHDTNNRLGIGTTNPTYGIDVQGSGVLGQMNGSAGLCIAGDCRDFWPDINYVDTATEGAIPFMDSQGRLTWDSNYNFFWSATDNRLGVGTAIPSFALHVSSFAKAGAFCDNTNVCISTWSALSQYFVRLTGDQMTGPLRTTTATISGAGVTGTSSIFTVGGATFTALLSGNVGIGTSSPLHPLHLMHSDDGGVSGLPVAGTIENTAGAANLVFKSGTTDCNAIFSSSMTAAALLANNGSKVIQMEMCGASSPSVFRVGEASLGNTMFVDVTNMGVGITQAPGSSNLFVVGNSSMVVSRAGFVGVGMASPSNPLQVLSNTFTVTMGGQVGVGTSNPTQSLHVVGGVYNTGQSIVGGTLTVQGADFSVGGSTFVVNAGGVGIGTTLPNSSITNPTLLKIVSDSAGTSGPNVIQESYAPATPVTRWIGRASSGTVASPVLIPSSRQIMVVGAQGYDGTTFRNAVQLSFDVDGTPGASDMPGRFSVNTTPDGSTAATERLRIDSSGNMGLGVTSFGSSAAKVLAIGNGTAPGSSPADAIQLYAEDVASSSELKVRDEASNITTLSPHNFKRFTPDPEDPAIPWSYYSRNAYVGKEINVDMLKLARLVERLTGETIIYVGDMPDSEVRDWNADQESKLLQRNVEIAAWDAATEKTGERPKPYVKKAAPAWLAPRLKRK